MLNKNAKKWIKALRSGKYKQTKNCLRDGNKFCCLGVACDISKQSKWDKDNEEYLGEGTQLPYEVMKWLGLASDIGSFKGHTSYCSLVDMNDNGISFKKIADTIESKPEGLFESND